MRRPCADRDKMERPEESKPERQGRGRDGGRRAPRQVFSSPRRPGRGRRGGPFFPPAHKPPLRPGLTRREAPAGRRQQWGARQRRGRGRRRLHGGPRPRSGTRGGWRRPPPAKRRGRTRGEGGAAPGSGGAAHRRQGRTGCSRGGSRPTVGPGSASRPQHRLLRRRGPRALTYLVELFAHIRVNVYVVHTVRHLPSASAAAAATSCKSARRGSSSGSSGGGGARCVTSEGRGGGGRGRASAPLPPVSQAEKKHCTSEGTSGFFCVSGLGLGGGAGRGWSQSFPETVVSRCPWRTQAFCDIFISQFYLHFSQPGLLERWKFYVTMKYKV